MPLLWPRAECSANSDKHNKPWLRRQCKQKQSTILVLGHGTLPDGRALPEPAGNMCQDVRMDCSHCCPGCHLWRPPATEIVVCWNATFRPTLEANSLKESEASHLLLMQLCHLTGVVTWLCSVLCVIHLSSGNLILHQQPSLTTSSSTTSLCWEPQPWVQYSRWGFPKEEGG